MLRRFIAVALIAAFMPASLFAEPEARRKLVVLLVFDQLRGDYLARWQALYGKGGFERLTSKGVWFDNCHYDYAHTVTAAGHASLVTGCGPSKHGIMGNDWYDRQLGRKITSVENERYTPVPDLPPIDPPKKGQTDEVLGTWPGRRLQPSVGDVLHKMSSGKGKVISLSIKDRSAILLASLLAFACYWFDGASGAFVTSTYYRDTPHAWVTEFNQSKVAEQWFGKEWTRLRDAKDYPGPDDVEVEADPYKMGKTFPHKVTGGQKLPGGIYYDALTTSPYGNDLLMLLAKRAIEAEALGQDDVPDLLCLSFSSNDLVGHAWGPDSHEVLDITLRTDLLLKEFLEYLDARVGKDNYAVVLSADHGICPLPDLAKAAGKGGGRIDPNDMLKAANKHLNQTFGVEGYTWIDSSAASTVYLNHKLLADLKIPPATAERALADWIVNYPGIQSAYTRSDLVDPVEGDALQKLVRRSYFAGRSGDVFLVNRPYWLLSSRKEGTTHGAPHEYDTHVPLLVYGAGVPSAVVHERITPLAAAPILAHLLGIDPPAGAEMTVPKVLRR